MSSRSARRWAPASPTSTQEGTLTTFGFTYATLPGHPEQGIETFRLELDDQDLRLHITGESRPALLLNKLSGPIGPIMQKRFIRQYAESMRAGIKAG